MGWVFTPRHLLDLASRPAITSALRRQTEAGAIRQLGRGLYDYPKLHPTLGALAPTPEALAKAMAGRDRVRLQPSGAYAANLVGLSEQVPAKVVFLTDGPSRINQVGPMTLQLRRTTPRNMAAAGRPSGLVIQALRHLGAEHVTPERIASESDPYDVAVFRMPEDVARRLENVTWLRLSEVTLAKPDPRGVGWIPQDRSETGYKCRLIFAKRGRSVR